MSLDLPQGAIVRLDEPMARHSPWRIGGPCDAWVVVHRRTALPAVLTALRGAGWKLTLWGTGSQQVVREGGLAGAVVQLGGDLQHVAVEGDELVVGAGAPLAVAVSMATRSGLRGLDGLAREPGTLGGLLASGAEGAWTDRVVSVDYLRRNAEKSGPLERARKGSNVFLSCRFQLDRAEVSEVAEAVRATVRGTRASADRAPFSWWKADDGGGAERLMVRTGLSGVRLRGVEIPSGAPGMFVNLGGGTVDDLTLLQKSVTDRVKRATGVVLAPRVTWLGQTRR